MSSLYEGASSMGGEVGGMQTQPVGPFADAYGMGQTTYQPGGGFLGGLTGTGGMQGQGASGQIGQILGQLLGQKLGTTGYGQGQGAGLPGGMQMPQGSAVRYQGPGAFQEPLPGHIVSVAGLLDTWLGAGGTMSGTT